MSRSRATDFGFRPLIRVQPTGSIRTGSEKGAALYELAMVLPLLSMLLVGIIYCGIAFYDYVALENAVAAGARILAISAGAGAGPPTACSLAETALKNAAGSLHQSQITIAPETFGASTCASLHADDWATISASYPCNLAIPFTGVNLCPVQGSSTSTTCPFSYCISSTTTVRIE